MTRHSKTEKMVDAAVSAARTSGRIVAVTTKREAKRMQALLAEYEDGSRSGGRWDFGPGSVEVVT